MPKRDRREREDLKDRILISYLDGVKPERFCAENELPLSSYYHYLKLLCERIRKYELNKQHQLVVYFWMRARQRVAKLHRLYEESEAAGKANINLLMAAHRTDMDVFDRLLAIGVLRKIETEPVVVGGAGLSPLDRMIEDAKRQVEEKWKRDSEEGAAQTG